MGARTQHPERPKGTNPMQSKHITNDAVRLQRIRARRRAERLILGALESLLENYSMDISWFSQSDLNPEDVLRGGRINDFALSAFMAILEKELGGWCACMHEANSPSPAVRVLLGWAPAQQQRRWRRRRRAIWRPV